MMRKTSRKLPGRTLLNSVLVLEGAGALAIQMLAIRQAAPWTGQSIAVVSIVVSTFLGALAIGYAWGGRYQGENALETAGWTLLAGASVAAALAGQQGTAMVMNFAMEGGAGTIAAAAVYAGAMVLPCAACLGRAVVLISTCYPAPGSGARTGRTFAWSTVGNVAGGLLVPLVVMQQFGTEVSVALAATCLGLAGALCVQRQSGTLVAMAILTGSASLAGFEAAKGTLSTAYGHYKVTVHNERGEKYRILWADGAAASRHDATGRGWRYIERIEDHLWPQGTSRTRVRRIAVLGAAGMTLGEGRESHDQITYVDIEPKTRHLARVLRDGAAAEKRLVIDDARAWLRGEDAKSWDIIVIDVYRGRLAAGACNDTGMDARGQTSVARGWDDDGKYNRERTPRTLRTASRQNHARCVRRLRDRAGPRGERETSTESTLHVPKMARRRGSDRVPGYPVECTRRRDLDHQAKQPATLTEGG